MDEQEIVSSLDAPGAGLPVVQEWVLKHLIFPVLRRVISVERAFSIIEKQGAEALILVRKVAEEDRFKQVLIPRMVGIEDSSRYWSLMMTLDHILIVSSAVAGLMKRLSRGDKIDEIVDTADVKPANEAKNNIEGKYERFLSHYRKKVERCVINWESENCHIHPWFGCLNPHGWVVMLAVHQWVHKKQIQKIIERLTNQKGQTRLK